MGVGEGIHTAVHASWSCDHMDGRDKAYGKPYIYIVYIKWVRFLLITGSRPEYNNKLII